MTKQLLNGASVFVFSAGIFLANTAVAETYQGDEIRLPVQKIAPGKGEIEIDFILPENNEFKADKLSSMKVHVKDADVLQPAIASDVFVEIDLSNLPYQLEYKAFQGETNLMLDMNVNYFNKKTQSQITESVRMNIPVKVETGKSASIRAQVPLCLKILVCLDK